MFQNVFSLFPAKVLWRQLLPPCSKLAYLARLYLWFLLSMYNPLQTTRRNEMKQTFETRNGFTKAKEYAEDDIYIAQERSMKAKLRWTGWNKNKSVVFWKIHCLIFPWCMFWIVCFLDVFVLLFLMTHFVLIIWRIWFFDTNPRYHYHKRCHHCLLGWPSYQHCRLTGNERALAVVLSHWFILSQ